MTITWKIDALDCKPQEGGLNDVVITAHWRCNAADGEHNASVYSAIGLGTPSAQSFIPYNQLTESQVVAWVKSAMGQEAVQAAEESVAQQIQSLIAPAVVTLPLPWST
jgi:hypothetical protein